MDAEVDRSSPIPLEPPTPPPFVRAWWRRLASPYLAMSLLAVAVAAILAARRPWGIDFWVHVTAVNRLSQDLLDPGGLQTAGTGVESVYYSPYTVVLALLAQLTGLSGATVLSLAAPAWAALLCFAFFRFARLFGDGAWYPVIAMGIAVTLWGWRMWADGGLLDIFGLPVTLPLPSTMATAFMLLVWTLVVRVIDQPRVWPWMAIAALATLILLCHPATAVGTGAGCVALLIWRGPSLDARAIAGLAASLAAVAVAVFTWPYYPVAALLGSAADPTPTTLYAAAWPCAIFVLLASSALWSRLRADRRDPLVWTVVLCLVAAVVGELTGYRAVAATLPPLMIAAQLALAVELYRRRGQPRAARWWAAAVTMACAVGLLFNIGNLLYALPPNAYVTEFQARVGYSPQPADYAWLSEYAAVGDTVLADDLEANRIITAYGVYTVAPGWRDPVVPDTTARRTAAALFFSGDTEPAARDDIVRRYHVNWILYVKGDNRILPSIASLVVVGPAGQRLYRAAG
ncbi:MAG TPA: hypothetical protein VE172_11510 [Stackebrandtia sp.]|jgi:alpha-1,6-mannosyltransferase|uniref:hypothetical protein n=1 Tax=Stackebrandtia sp. TaxID=2023065 RepID=UPI002D446FB7|nr:hypothetical protein [Stackebrandtia sp.]HZE39426.1 hypothetical protein [Stackebrandtia sp.]